MTWANTIGVFMLFLALFLLVRREWRLRTAPPCWKCSHSLRQHNLDGHACNSLSIHPEVIAQMMRIPALRERGLSEPCGCRSYYVPTYTEIP